MLNDTFGAPSQPSRSVPTREYSLINGRHVIFAWTKLTGLFVLWNLFPVIDSVGQSDWKLALNHGQKLAAMHLAQWQAMAEVAANGTWTDPEEILVHTANDSLHVSFIALDSMSRPIVSGAYTTDRNANTGAGHLSISNRPLSDPESRILRAYRAMDADWEARLGKFYQQVPGTTMYRLVLEGAKQDTAYLYTTSGDPKQMIFGNDYRLTLSKEGKILSRTALHANVQGVEVKPGVDKTAHTHGKNGWEGITATDVCTLELYGRLTDWKFHYVVGPKWVDALNLLDGEMTRLPRGVWEENMKNGK